MKYDIVERIRDAFDDTDEVVSWITADLIKPNTYYKGELRVHLIGLHEAALEACKEIVKLRRENKKLKEALNETTVS
jgi:flagellar biosynthesis regulator FlaF